jgi:hypothetical protein
MIFGFGLGIVWSFWPRVYVVLPLLGVFGLLAFPAMRLLDRPIHAMAKTRIKFMRGAQGEALVAWLLMDLENEWHVFNGMKLVENWDLDHVVVGPGGLFCVQTKSWRGLLSAGKDGRLYRNNVATDVLGQAVSQGMRLRERLAALLGEDVPYVQAVLAAPLAWVEGPVMQGRVMVVHQDNLVEMIAPEGVKKLKGNEVKRCADALLMLQKSAKGLYREAQ